MILMDQQIDLLYCPDPLLSLLYDPYNYYDLQLYHEIVRYQHHCQNHFYQWELLTGLELNFDLVALVPMKTKIGNFIFNRESTFD